MCIRMLLTFILLFSSLGWSQMADDPPPSFDEIKPTIEADQAVSLNANKAVEKSRKIFKKAHDKGSDQFKKCKENLVDNVTSCLLAGVVYNYALSFAGIIGYSEDFRMTITGDDKTDKDFSDEEKMLA